MFYSTLCLKIDAYFNDVFELYTAKHRLLRFVIQHLVADSTWSNQIVSLDTCILYNERSLGKGNKLNIPWLLVCIGEGRKTWTINWHVSPSHSKNGGRLKSRWHEDLLQSKSASFSCMLGWLLWLEIVMYASFYIMLENGYTFLRSFWIKQQWTKACLYHSTTFGCELKRS